MSGSTRMQRFNDWLGPPIGGRKGQWAFAMIWIVMALYWGALSVEHLSSGAWVRGLFESIVAVGGAVVSTLTIVKLRRT